MLPSTQNASNVEQVRLRYLVAWRGGMGEFSEDKTVYLVHGPHKTLR
jgi:hypothetical protein